MTKRLFAWYSGHVDEQEVPDSDITFIRRSEKGKLTTFIWHQNLYVEMLTAESSRPSTRWFDRIVWVVREVGDFTGRILGAYPTEEEARQRVAYWGIFEPENAQCFVAEPLIIFAPMDT